MTEHLTKEQLRDLVKEAVHETLVQMGVDTRDPLEMQRDFQHLRDWRQAQEMMKTKGRAAIIGVLVTGFLGLVWIGLKATILKEFP